VNYDLFLDGWTTDILAIFALIVSIYSLLSTKNSRSIQYALVCAQRRNELLLKHTEAIIKAKACQEILISTIKSTKNVTDEVATQETGNIHHVVILLGQLDLEIQDKIKKLNYLADEARNLNISHKMKKKQSLLMLDALNDTEAKMQEIISRFNELSSTISNIQTSYSEYLENPN
jgi:hypothetical protein